MVPLENDPSDPVEMKSEFSALDRFRASVRRSRRPAYIVTTRVVGALFGVAQMSALARLLPTDQYAAVASGIAVGSYFMLTSEPALLGYERLGTVDLVGDQKSGGIRGVAQLYLVILAIALLSGSVAWGAWRGLVLLSVGVATWVISLYQLRWASIQLLNWGQTTRYGTLTMVNSAVRTLSLAVAAALTSSGAIALLVGGAASIVVTAVVGPSFGEWSTNWAKFRELMKVGLPMTVASAAITALGAWPTIAASSLLPQKEFASFIAQYGLGNSIAGATLGFILTFGFPRAKRILESGDAQSAGSEINKNLWYIAAFSAVAAPAALLLGRWLTALILGPDFIGERLLLVGVLMSALTSVYRVRSWVLMLNYKAGSLGFVSALSALAQIPLVWFMTSWFGLAGLVCGVALVYFGQSLVASIMAGRRGMWGALTLSTILFLCIVVLGYLESV